MPWPTLLLLLLGCATAQEKQCDDGETTQLVFPPLPTDAAVASVLNDIHQHTTAAVCTAQTVRPWPLSSTLAQPTCKLAWLQELTLLLSCRMQANAVVAYLGGDDDLQACKMQGLWGKILRLAGAHAAAFAAGRSLLLPTPDSWVGGCEGGSGWPCYFEPPVARDACSLSTLGLDAALADRPDKVWSGSGWAPWSRDTPDDSTALPKPVLWSACGNQMKKYGGGAPHDHHSNDFWPMAPRPPLSRAHASVPVTAWQAAFLRDLTRQPTERTRAYVDRVAAGLGWQSPWSSGFAHDGHQYSGVIGLQIRRGDKYQAGKSAGQDQLSDLQAFQQVFLPAVLRLRDQRFGDSSVAAPPRVFLATDSRLIVQHVMEENGGVVRGLQFAVAGYASVEDGGERLSPNQSPQVPRDVWMRGAKGWGTGEYAINFHVAHSLVGSAFNKLYGMSSVRL